MKTQELRITERPAVPPPVNPDESRAFLGGRMARALTPMARLAAGNGHSLEDLGISRQINAIKIMADELAAERNLLRALIDSLPDHIYVKDPEGRFLAVNAALCDLLGVMSAERVVGRRSQDFLPTEQATKAEVEERQILASGTPSLNREYAIVDRAGHQRWMLGTRVPLRDGRGQTIGLVGIDRDITERKRSDEELRRAHASLAKREQELLNALADLTRSHDDLTRVQLQLVQAAKMESMGQLAAGTAHDVKNPLAVIVAGVEYLLNSKLSDGEMARRVLSEMSEAVSRADGVVRGLLQFSLPHSLTLTKANLNVVITQSLKMVKHELVRTHATLAQDLANDLPPVLIDASKMQQVFINLFMNAIQAMVRGGMLTVRTFQTQLASLDNGRSVASAGKVAPGRVVVAEVEDTGHGIPQDKLHKVFEPFFTLKGAKGSGLGLAVVRTIIELHGGMVQIRNQPKAGVKATLILHAE